MSLEQELNIIAQEIYTPGDIIINKYIKNGSKGDLDLSNITELSLPNDLIVNGSLYLHNTKITLLPSGLIINGALDLSNSSIIQLPDDLQVSASLRLFNTPISKNKKLLEQYKIRYICQTGESSLETLRFFCIVFLSLFALIIATVYLIDYIKK
jgi:hypothetical protein